MLSPFWHIDVRYLVKVSDLFFAILFTGVTLTQSVTGILFKVYFQYVWQIKCHTQRIKNRKFLGLSVNNFHIPVFLSKAHLAGSFPAHLSIDHAHLVANSERTSVTSKCWNSYPMTKEFSYILSECFGITHSYDQTPTIF